MKFQIAKLYRGELFIGYGLAVNGQLLDNLVSTVIDTQSTAPSLVGVPATWLLCESGNYS